MPFAQIFEIVLILIGLAQNPNLPLQQRQQALASATQTLQVVSTQILSMNTTTTPENTQPQTPAPAAPVNNEPSNQSNPQPSQNEPVLGAAEPTSLYTVEGIQPIPKSGGVLTFTVKKNNKPIEEIDKVSGNVTNQVFLRLPEDLPPGRGQFHIYIPEQTKDLQNPSLNLELSGETVNVPISFTQ